MTAANYSMVGRSWELQSLLVEDLPTTQKAPVLPGHCGTDTVCLEQIQSPKSSCLCMSSVAFPIRPSCHSALELEGIRQRIHSPGPSPDSGHVILPCLRLPPMSGMICFPELGAMSASVIPSSLRSVGCTLAICVAFLLDKGCSIRRTCV